MEQKESAGNKPEKKFRAGAVSATIWKNKGKKANGEEFEYSTISIDRNYKDGEDWKTSNSFRVNDLPKLGAVADLAYKYLVSKEE